MAPTPRNTTDRIKVSYQGPFGRHTMLLHAVDGAPLVAVIPAVRSVITAMDPLTYAGTTFDAASAAAAGLDVFQDISGWVPIVHTGGAAPSVSSSPSTFLQFVGRDPEGVRVSLYLFEVSSAFNVQMRYGSGSDPLVGDVVAALQFASSVVGTVAGGPPTWKPYANIGSNDYITHRARRS